jgi:tellurite resistance protein
MPRLLTSVPVAFFGIVLGIAGFGGAWTQASHIWPVSSSIGAALGLMALAVWMLLTVLYLAKWLLSREQALAEFRHPIQCCFVALWPISGALVAAPLRFWLPRASALLAFISIAGALLFGIFRQGGLWQGGRDPTTTTPALYLPTVAASLISTIVLSSFGYFSLAGLLFGIGVFSWLAIESVILHRLLVVGELSPALRPTLGIQLAPPSVACVAYESISQGPPDLLTQALIGYALFQLLLLGRLTSWIRRQPFNASYWAFAFGASALPTAMIQYVDRGGTGAVAELAPIVFTIANILAASIAIATVWQLLTGRLLAAIATTPQPERVGSRLHQI